MTEHKPLTKEMMMWLDDETDMVFYAESKENSKYERNVVDLDYVRSAVEYLKSTVPMWAMDEDACLQAIDNAFPVFVEKEEQR